jgi:hypothetical protein
MGIAVKEICGVFSKMQGYMQNPDRTGAGEFISSPFFYALNQYL